MSPELHAMVTGIISALTTVFWGLPGEKLGNLGVFGLQGFGC